MENRNFSFRLKNNLVEGNKNNIDGYFTGRIVINPLYLLKMISNAASKYDFFIVFFHSY